MTKITEQRLSELNCSTITDREIRKLVKAYRKAKYGDEWIEWGGRAVPTIFARGQVVETRHRGGDEYTGTAAKPWDWWYDAAVGDRRGFWVHDCARSNIIAYRVVNK